MNLTLHRYAQGEESTAGLLFINGRFFCDTCEDQAQRVKVPDETRIPAGRYRILLRNAGGMTKRYAKLFDFHRGMLWLQDVPGFEWIYIHIGNTDDHTSGCILVGRGVDRPAGECVVRNSTDTYADLYNLVLLAMGRGEEVWIEVVDEGLYAAS